MKRSGSKLIAKAGSVKNISKSGYRFDIELVLESVDNMLGTSDVVCTWERGPKVVVTAPCKINKQKRTVDFDGASLKQEVTMFKKKKSDAGFEPKVFRLAVRQNGENGRVVGKIDLNFADYGELPSFSKRIGAPLSSGSRLVLRVNTRYLGEAEKRGKKKKPKDDDASSMYSDSTLGASDKYSVAAAEELAERDRDEQDLDDLAVDDPPPPAADFAAARAGSAGARPAPPDAPEPRRPPGRALPSRADAPRAQVAKQKLPSRDPYDGGRAGGGYDAGRGGGGGGHGGGGGAGRGGYGAAASAAPAAGRYGSEEAGASRGEVERIRAENKGLRRENDQLREKLAERGGGGGYGGGGDEEVRALSQENANLRRDVEELEARISREPVYADVVRDLRESKMALAILTMERDELQQTVRTNSNTANGIANRNLL